MNMHESFAPSGELTAVAAAPPRSRRIRSLCTRLVAWARAWADYHAAAAAYEDLSRLSDAQLKRRGLSRDILVCDLRSDHHG